MMNKRGIEALVATVLLVLIVIAAVGIIWGAVMPIIKQNIDTSQKCLNTGIEINAESGYTYFIGGGVNNVSVQVSRGPSTIEVTNIAIKVIDSTGNSNSSLQSDVPSQNSDKVYVLKMSDLGLTGTAKRVGVAPTIVIGKTNVACPMKEVDLP